MNSPQSMPLARRAVLRGLGASLALPWLESLPVRAAEPIAGPPAERPPVRWGCVLFANGVSPADWWAHGAGEAMQLSPTLEPLAPHKRHITVLRELHVYNNTAGPHWPLFTNFLNAARLRETLIPEAAESIDQLIARHVGRHTAVPSLVLGVEPAESGLRSGVPGVYYATVSWSSRSTPVPPEIYPRGVFDRLFDTSGLLRDRSVLDVVMDQSRSLRRRLADADRQKLDEFSHSVRDLELRIERAARDERLEGWRPALQKPDMARPPEALPQDVRAHMRMMLDLLLLAWQMDRTRVATLILNRDVSHMQFNFLEGVGNEQLHSISHHKNKPATLAQYQRINRFHVEQLAYLIERMKGIDEGNGSTLLDNVMLLFGSNMFNGDIHDGRNLPLILAGHGGGAIAGGRVLDFTDAEEPQQRACNLYLAMAQRMGVKIEAFGDSVAPLPGLL